MFGENHPDVATSYNNLGLVYYSQGNYPQALEYHQKSLEINRKLYGDFGNNVQQSLYAVYYAYMQCIAEDKSFDVNQYQSFLSEVAFIAATQEEDTPTSQQGMSGVYYLLEYEDWNQEVVTSLSVTVEEFKGKPQTIVVMKDGVISKHYFENTIGVQFGLEIVGKEEKARITEAYNKWKQQNK